MKYLICLFALLNVSIYGLWVKTDPSCINGHVYTDTNMCECFPCYTGSDCSVLNDTCLLPAETNQAFVAEQWWVYEKQGAPTMKENS